MKVRNTNNFITEFILRLVSPPRDNAVKMPNRIKVRKKKKNEH